MRDSVKITIPYQFFRIILTQAAASGIAFVFGAVAFWYFTNVNIVKQLISCAFILVNFILLYSASRKFALMDSKPYTPLKPSVLKGFAFGGAVSLLNIIFSALFMLLWKLYGTDAGIEGVLPTVYNAFFFLWSYPYNGIMNLSHGSFTWYSAAVMIAMPVTATAAGYIAGIRRFDIFEKIEGMAYEKDE